MEAINLALSALLYASARPFRPVVSILNCLFINLSSVHQPVEYSANLPCHFFNTRLVVGPAISFAKWFVLILSASPANTHPTNT